MKHSEKDNLPELLTISEAASLLKVHQNTLRNWDKQGILKPRRIGVRGLRRYEKASLLDYLKQAKP